MTIEIINIITRVIKPFLVPICLMSAWLLIILIIGNISSAIALFINQTKHIQQIPCPKCKYCTFNYVLKCPVRPITAMTEAAINCHDYSPIKN